MTSNCRKFVPNIFNKNKCQNCFKAKEQHSAEALESAKVARKISKCGYLFISPDFDFGDPLQKTRRWQRRFFVLYDDGELSFSVDDNPHTVPQGLINMNKCTDVFDAENVTSHEFSICIQVPDKVHYVKGTCKEEISRWHDVLVMYPRSIKTKHRRSPTYPGPASTIKAATSQAARNAQGSAAPTPAVTKSASATSVTTFTTSATSSSSKPPLPRQRYNSSYHPPSSSSVEQAEEKKKEEENRIQSPRKTEPAQKKDLQRSRSDHGVGATTTTNKPNPDTPNVISYRGVRSLKHKSDKAYHEGLRKSNSMHDLTDGIEKPTFAKLRVRSRSKDNLYGASYAVTGSANRRQRFSSSGSDDLDQDPFLPASEKSKNFDLSPKMTHDAYQKLANIPTLKPLENYEPGEKVKKGVETSPRRAETPKRTGSYSRSISLDRFSGFRAAMSETSPVRGGKERPASVANGSVSNGGKVKEKLKKRAGREKKNVSSYNETDELKMARSSVNGQDQNGEEKEDMSYMKKGWLVKQGKKHWFVLGLTALKYYADSSAEELDVLDGRIDLTTCYEVAEATVNRNYGFKLKTKNGEHVLSAMTQGIRNNWVQAIQKCVDKGLSESEVAPPTGATASSTASQQRAERKNSESHSSSHETDSVDGDNQDSPSTQGGLGSDKEGAAGSPARREGNFGLRQMRELTPEEEDELDYVEKNIRHINRKSIIDMQQAKPKFLDKFEKGEEEETKASPPTRARSSDSIGKEPRTPTKSSPPPRDASAKDIVPKHRHSDSNDSSRSSSSSASRSPPSSSGQKDAEKAERKDSIGMRAKSPSAKVMDKTRSRSPRARSPPPDLDDELFLDKMAEKLGQKDDTGNSARLIHNIIEKKWQQVESLKAQLERTTSELTNMQEANMDLKSQLKSNRRDHRDSLENMETDSTQYLTQVQTLRMQMHEAKETINKMEMENKRQKEKLDIAVKELSDTQSSLIMAESDLKEERSKANKITTETSKKEKEFEQKLKDLQTKLDRSLQDTRSKNNQSKISDKDMKGKNERIKELEIQVQKFTNIQRELNEKASKMAEVMLELREARKEVSRGFDRTKNMERDYDEKIDEMEKEFNQEKKDLQTKIKNMEQRLQSAMKTSNITDHLNTNMADILREKDETIAQLEEKVIECDNRIEELEVELNVEMEDNSTMQHNLDMCYDTNTKLKTQAINLEKQVRTMQSEVVKGNQENDALRVELDRLQREAKGTADHRIELKGLQLQLQSKDKSLKEKVTEIKKLKALADNAEDSNDILDKYETAIEEMEKLSAKLKQSERTLAEERESYVDELSIKQKEHKALKKRAEELQVALSEATENLEEARRENERPQMPAIVEVSVGGETVSEDEHKEMVKKHERAVQEIKRLRQEVKTAQDAQDDMELRNLSLRKQMQSTESDFKDQMDLMTQRVQDLTNKLAVSERSLRKIEQKSAKKAAKDDAQHKASKESVSNELETQLTELECKIVDVESALRIQESERVSLDTQIGSVEQKVGKDDSGAASIPAVKQQQQQRSVLTSMPANPEPELSDVQVRGLMQNEERLRSFINNLKNKINVAGEKLKQVTSKLLDQTTSQLELRNLRQGESKLKEQVKKYGEMIDNLKAAQRESFSAEESEVEKSEVEKKLSQTEAVLGACYTKLEEVVKSLDKLPRQDTCSMTFVSEVKKKLNSILLRARELVDTSSAGKGSVFLTEQDMRLRLFAEKIALEAVLLGEMAYLAQSHAHIDMANTETNFRSIHQANERITHLEDVLETLLTENKGHHLALKHKTDEYLKSYSSLLAEKIMMQGELTMLLHTHGIDISGAQSKLPQRTTQTNPSLGKMAKEACARSEIDERLLNSDIQVSSVENYASSVASRALAQGELSFMLNKFKRRASPGMTDQERIEMSEHELEVAQQRLEEREKGLKDTVEQFCSERISELAMLVAKDATIRPAESESSAICGEASKRLADKTINKELLGAEIAILVKKYGQLYENELQVECQAAGLVRESSEQTKQRHLQIEASIDKTIKDTVRDLNESYERLKASGDAGKVEVAPSARVDVIVKFADVLAQKAVIGGLVKQIVEQLGENPSQQQQQHRPRQPLRKHDSGINMSGSTPPSSPTQDVTIQEEDTEGLIRESASRQSVVEWLQKGSLGDSNVEDQILRVAQGMQALEKDLCKYHHHRSGGGGGVSDYAESIAREAVHQAELAYILQKVKLQYESQLAGLRKQQFQSSQQTPVDQKYQTLLLKEQNKNYELEQDIAKMKSECERLKSLGVKLEELEKRTSSERSSLEERSKSQVDSLRKELREAREALQRGGSSSSGGSSEDAALHQVQELQAELERLTAEHAKELEQVKLDWMTTVRAMQASGSESEDELVKQIASLKERLAETKSKHKHEVEQLQKQQESSKKQVNELESLLYSMQVDFENEMTRQKEEHQQELARSKENMSLLLATADMQNLPVDEDAIKKRYEKEINRLREMCDSGFESMQQSHKRALEEMRAAHKEEVERLQQEKETVLEEETQATHAALDAMRKAHEAEVQQEKAKFREMVKNMFSHSDMDNLEKQHDEERENLKREIQFLTEQYSIKCLEHASIEERFQTQAHSLQDSRKHIHELMARNDDLNKNLKSEIAKLNKSIEAIRLAGAEDQKDTDKELSQMALSVKDVEIQQLKQEVSGLEEELHCSQEIKWRLSKCFVSIKEKDGQIKELRAKLDEAEKDSKGVRRKKDSDSQSRSSESRSRSRSISPDHRSVSSDLAIKKSPSAGLVETRSKIASRRSKDPRRAMSNPSIPPGALSIHPSSSSSSSSSIGTADVPSSIRTKGYTVTERLQRFSNK